ncbi:MAG: DNA-deoxyinosine glycosylase [Victivallaceae bacterium]|nr:DNA-deoxyinosine glycosylase [Victivallaceae bacterium]
MNPVECRSFPPSADENARILVLGSMPGGESLLKQQYYAFRFNVFWRIAGEVFDFSPAAEYEERLATLRSHGVALWDVLSSCDRAGSLDGAIRKPCPNDIPRLLRSSPHISKILCNGQAAAGYLRRFFPELAAISVAMPSTSPAAARLSFDGKLAAWRRELSKSN